MQKVNTIPFLRRISVDLSIKAGENYISHQFTGIPPYGLVRGFCFMFQTDRADVRLNNRSHVNQRKNNSVFDNLDVTSYHITIGPYTYPTIKPNRIDFRNNNIAAGYDDYLNFYKTFHSDDGSHNPMVSNDLYRQVYPMYCIDCYRQNDLKAVDKQSVTLYVAFGEPVPVNTRLYGVLYVDSRLDYVMGSKEVKVF